MSAFTRVPLRSSLPTTLPKIVIDARMLGEVPHGIARYVAQIAHGLYQRHQITPLPYTPIFLVHAQSKAQSLSSFETVVAQSEFLNPREIFEIPKILKEMGASLYHSPSFSSLWNSPCPTAVTIHDLNHLTYGSISKKIYYQTLLRRFSKKSLTIMTVSEFSRKEISHWLRIPETQIQVVYNAMDPKQFQLPDSQEVHQILERHGLKQNEYFFCLSNPKPHKNLPMLVDAYMNFRKQVQKAWPLVLTVNSKDCPQLANCPGIQTIGGLNQHEASVLLAGAAGMLFPSLYEGFGLPPLEAALSMTPLAVSLIPPHQEGLSDLKGNEVLWVQPNDIHGWTSAFHKLQKGELARPSQETRQKIFEHFSTERLGLHMDQIYRDMLQRIT